MKSLRRLVAHRLTKNTLALLAIQLVNYCVPLVVLVHLAKALGVERYGVVALAISITQIGQIVIDAGFMLSATALIARRRGRPQIVGQLVSAVISAKLLILLPVALGIAAFALLTDRYSSHLALLLLTLLPLLGTSLQPIWLFQGLERMEFLSLVTFVSKLSYATLVLTLVQGPDDYLWIIACDGLTQLLAATIYFLIMFRLGVPLLRPRLRNLRFAFKLTAPFFASRVAVTAYQGSGTLILGAMLGPVAAATYSLADQLYRGLQQIFVPFVQALYPYMASERDLRLLAATNVAGIAIAVAGALAMKMLAPLIVGYFFSPQWLSALPIVDIFLLAIVVHVMAVLSGYPLAVAVGRLDVANRSVIIGAFVFAAGLCILIFSGQLGGRSVAALMIVAESYVFLHRAFALWPLVAAKLKQQQPQGVLP